MNWRKPIAGAYAGIALLGCAYGCSAAENVADSARSSFDSAVESAGSGLDSAVESASSGFDSAVEAAKPKISEAWEILSATPEPRLSPMMERYLATKAAALEPLNASLIEQHVIRYVNETRERESLKPFVHDPAISSIARAHSEDMIENGFKHTGGLGTDPSMRAKLAGYTCGVGYVKGLSENIHKLHRASMWMGDYPASQLEDEEQVAFVLMAGWMNSSGHRRNILDPYAKRIGVGIAIHRWMRFDYETETVYATQNFSSCTESEVRRARQKTRQ